MGWDGVVHTHTHTHTPGQQASEQDVGPQEHEKKSEQATERERQLLVCETLDLTLEATGTGIDTTAYFFYYTAPYHSSGERCSQLFLGPGV